MQDTNISLPTQKNSKLNPIEIFAIELYLGYYSRCLIAFGYSNLNFLVDSIREEYKVLRGFHSQDFVTQIDDITPSLVLDKPWNSTSKHQRIPIESSKSKFKDENLLTNRSNTSTVSDCISKKWPKMAIFVPVSLSSDPLRINEFQTFLLRSLLLFWPLEQSNVSLVAVIDYEQKYDSVTNRLTNEYLKFERSILKNKHRFLGGINIKVNKFIDYYNSGHDRQQYLQMTADEYIDDPEVEYIGIVDTDSLFITYVELGDIFENGKPVINGRFGTYSLLRLSTVWSKVPEATFNVTGLLEPMRTMSYFPVVVKRSDFSAIRQYLIDFNKIESFGEIYKNRIETVPNNWYCAFHVMTTYLFYHRKDQYKWYLHPMNRTWDGINPSPDKRANGDLSLYSKEMYYPKPRVAVHARYLAKNELQVYKSLTKLNLLFQEGLCFSPPFPHSSSFCNTITKKGYWEEMHRFEFFDWTLPNSFSILELQDAYTDRYNRIKNCPFNISRDELHLAKLTY